MTHPSDADLALYSGGDLGVFDRWRVRRHLENCSACSGEVDALRGIVSELADAADSAPEGLRWDRLADEMTANIRLGLQAGECVATVSRASVRIDWRGAAVMAGMSIVLLAAWYLNPVPRGVQHVMRAPRVEIRTTSAGLELNENGNALVLLNGNGAHSQRAIIVSAPGSLRARYADGETGQITINNVYSE